MINVKKAQELILKHGKTVRIFTGAPLPHGTDTVVMQEFVESVSDDVIAI